MKITSGSLVVEVYPKTGKTEISYAGERVIPIISPAIYYDEEFLTEQNGAVQFDRMEEVPGEVFEGRADAHLGQCTCFNKFYTVNAPGESFTCVVHVHVLVDLQQIYVDAEIAGNGAKSDAIGGFIDLGVPENVQTYRFFHGGPRGPVQDQENTGLAYFTARQDAWQFPCVSDHLPNNEGYSISYLLGKLPRGIVACAPVNRYGQRSVIRASNIVDVPHSLKIVSGNYLRAQQYDHLAGGLIAFHEDAFEVTSHIFEAYMEIVERPHALRANKEYPEPFEYLGFCTWNTFYASVDAQGIIDLAESNFTADQGSDRFRYLIIDDGWQSINGMDVEAGPAPHDCKTRRGLRNLGPNFKFPSGMRQLVDQLKSHYKMKWVGVWVATSGYWDGIEPNSPVGQRYAIVQNGGTGFADPNNLHGQEFWTDYFRAIRSWGMDLLKIDNQCSMGTAVEGMYPIDDGIRNIYAMHQGAAYAQNLVILNCMCMASDNKIYWTKSNVSRVSDDFGPGNIAGTKYQINQCVFNPIFYAQFCWPDHDMLQTVGITHPLVLLHAASGGPIYIADEVGETDPEVVSKLCFPDGRLARLDAPGLNTYDCLFRDVEADYPAKMWNYHALEGWGKIYYEFITNVTKDTEDLPVEVGLADMGITSGDEPTQYVLEDRESHECHLVDATTPHAFRLDNFDARYFVYSPLLRGIAVLGVDEVYNGTKAIAAVEWASERSLVLRMAYEGALRLYFADTREASRLRAVPPGGIPLPVYVTGNTAVIADARGILLLDWS
ncbi:MAG TPA: Sip1-related alpha-galactosidase [Candidatus Lokiarchaeia archaeon]|nr:Sip1-related alpha-galactosidase [Candidatus Lokiarchaeia archaeon]